MREGRVRRARLAICAHISELIGGTGLRRGWGGGRILVNRRKFNDGWEVSAF